MTVDHKITTVEEFERLAQLPENDKRSLELLDGEIVEVPTNRFAAWIAFEIAHLLRLFISQTGRDRAWFITTGDGGYDMAGSVLAPDVALSDEPPGAHGFDKVIPMLAVEVISNSANREEQSVLRRKVAYYLRLGVTVWVVEPEAQKVEVFKPDEQTQILGQDDTLTDEALLPGFSMPLARIFRRGAQEE